MAAPSSDQKFLGFLPQEAVPGALLVFIAALAMVVVNSPWGAAYQSTLSTSFSIGPTGGGVEMKLAYWIKNALMALFFFFVGLELKREMLEGQLSNPKAALLPVLAAAGGMAAPALIYGAFAGSAGFGKGWAIPAATDIAFALGVLSLLGNRVPPALKAFLLAVAVVDDLGAILIVAFFYTEQVLSQYLFMAVGVSAVLLVMNRLKLASIGLYVLVGMVLWVVMYRSGISPTIGGVIVAACVPLKDKAGHSPLHEAEHAFRPWVLFGIMPVFAFANAGISLDGASAYLTHPITLGAALGLAVGKPLGIGLMTYLGAMLMRANKPGNLMQIIGVGCIAGVGFTMSLFVGALAFTDPVLATPVRLGVYAGSIVSALVGLVILTYSLPKTASMLPGETEDPTRPFILAEPQYEAYEKAKP
ncbi:Na+/H+ antiporter NhaA [Rhodoferax sp.]|uniref:Na+/H+ antiporter NhaA n=1 Tax=Rhodoferax sp. TaxID=50421 RepID=UPI0025DC93F7|nr:Na+/H+ antiporter NhaA [Rhodoferax sp.]